MNRRGWFTRAATALLGSGVAVRAAEAAPKPATASLPLKDFQPRSMLHVPETHVPRAKFPVIDIHTHLCSAAKQERGVPLSEERTHLAPTSESLEVMEHSNIQLLVNVTGGMGAGLRDSVQRYDRANAGRFLTFTEPWWSRKREEIGRAHV